MRNQRFYSYTVLCIFSAAITALLIVNISDYLRVVAGLTALSSLGFYELAERKASRTGKDRKMKITSSITEPLYEILILIPVLAALISLDPSNVSFYYLAISVIGAVLLSQLVEEKIVNKLRKAFKPRLGQKIRVSTLVLTIFLSYLNPFYIFYGISIVGVLALYDLLDIIYRSTRK